MTDKEKELISEFRAGSNKVFFAFIGLAGRRNLTANAFHCKAYAAFELLQEIEDALQRDKAKAEEEAQAKAEEEAWENG